VVVALAEIELARVHKAMDSFMQRRRPPAHIRPDLDLGFRIAGSEGDLRQISSCVARVLAASRFEMT
jgi:hypothetical protein